MGSHAGDSGRADAGASDTMSVARKIVPLRVIPRLRIDRLRGSLREETQSLRHVVGSRDDHVGLVDDC
jgi:hypothetical protein